MAINVIVQYNGGLLPDVVLLTKVTTTIIGNPFKYHVEASSLQPMKQYIVTTMLDLVLL